MKKCKWAGDMGDEYCKNCNGVTMDIDGNSTSCTECAGYEPGDEDVHDEFMNVPEEELPFEPDESTSTSNVEKSTEKTKKTTNTTNNTSNAKNVKIDVKDKEKSNENTSIKVSEEKKIKETTENTLDGIQVTSLRYTSSATVKKGDNYFKFTAEEEWSTALYNGDIQDVREQLWAKLNAEVDAQIEELNSIN